LNPANPVHPAGNSRRNPQSNFSLDRITPSPANPDTAKTSANALFSACFTRPEKKSKNRLQSFPPYYKFVTVPMIVTKQ
jgi:hypothetical protein